MLKISEMRKKPWKMFFFSQLVRIFALSNKNKCQTKKN